jgi:hypothetical protein
MIDLDIDELEKLCKYEINRGTVNPYTVNENPIHAMQELIIRLRQAEKDAARYRWIKANGQLGVGRCGIDWELYFEGPAPDNSAMIELHIDEAMQCK